MYESSLDELTNIMNDCLRWAQYARTNYDVLATEKTVHTLYGPKAAFLGALVPSSLTPARARILCKSTRRKEFVVYDLDCEYRPVKTTHVTDYHRVDCTYYHFVRNGVTYAYPFRGTGNQVCNDTIVAIKKNNDGVAYFATCAKSMLFVQFYEYESPETMIVSSYWYWPTAKYNMHGQLIDRNAPIGAPNSSVLRHCCREPVNNVDLSKWGNKS